MSNPKPLSEFPPETVAKWTESCFSPKLAKKGKKHRSRRGQVVFPQSFNIPSLNLLRAETERLGEAETPEETQSIQERIGKLQESVSREAEELREREMAKAEMLGQESTLRTQFPHLYENVPSVSKIVCPECLELDMGNRMNKTPWCMKCNVPLVPQDKLDDYKKMPKVKVAKEDPRGLTFIPSTL